MECLNDGAACKMENCSLFYSVRISVMFFLLKERFVISKKRNCHLFCALQTFGYECGNIRWFGCLTLLKIVSLLVEGDFYHSLAIFFCPYIKSRN